MKRANPKPYKPCVPLTPLQKFDPWGRSGNLGASMVLGVGGVGFLLWFRVLRFRVWG